MATAHALHSQHRSSPDAGAVSSFSPLHVCCGLHCTRHCRCFNASRNLRFPLYPRLILLQLAYASESKFSPGMRPPPLYSRSRTLNWGPRQENQISAGLSNDNMLEEGTAEVEDNSTYRGLRKGTSFAEDFSSTDEEMSSFQEVLDVAQSSSSDADLAVEEDALSSRDKSTWLQRNFIRIAGPIVKIMSGAHLNKPRQNYKQQKNSISWNPLKVLTGVLPSEYDRRRIGKKLRQAEADFFIFTSHVGKFLLIMMATGAVLATGFQLTGGDTELEPLLWCSWLAGIIIGSMIGAEKVMEKRLRSGPRNVVITGSTRGLGKALAREFLISGDRVVIASRSSDSVAETVEELQEEMESRLYHPFLMESIREGDPPPIRATRDGARVVGMACDVSKVADVRALAEFAAAEFGSIDIWINNAGVNKGFRPLVQFSDDDIRQIVSANLIGSLICTREAIRVMKSQPKKGHVFNMDGAGSGGSSTPLTAVYGATKCGLRQLHASLLKECKRSQVGIHTASPGMVLTDLLLSGASLQNKKMFNIICELPETVARTLVPRMREIKGTGKAINFLTPPRILLALVTAWLRRGRWFDEEGQAVYAAEADRLRNWAEGRTRLPFSAAMDQFSDNTLFSVFSITVICAFIMLSTTSGSGGLPGT